MICWMDSEASLTPRTIYTLKHTTRTVRAMVTDLRYRLDINTMHRDESATTLTLNEIGRVVIRSTEPVFVDDYRRNRAHRQLHPHRRVEQPHRRGRHGPPHELVTDDGS